MKISLKRNLLLKSLSHQQSLIERRSSIPILSYVLLEATGDGVLSLTGTDLEIHLRENIPADIYEPGKFTVPVHIFYDIVRKLPENCQLSMHMLENKHVKISSDNIEFILPTLPAEDFPVIQSQELPSMIHIPAHTLKELIDDTKFSMSAEENRYSLNGIYFHHHLDQWRAIATDMRRLALKWVVLPEYDLSALPCVIIGRKAIQEISKLLEECEHDISLSLSSHQLTLAFDNCLFSSRLLDGPFPDYWQAIPQEHPYHIDMDVSVLSQAVARVGMVSSEKQRLIKMSFQPQELILSAHSQQYGSATERLSIPFSGEAFDLGFNPKYFLDICYHMKGDTMRLILKDNVSPAKFQDLSDDTASYVLMPLRV